MATSGSSNVDIFSWFDLKFSWWVNSQSIANNTTTIGWKLEFITGNGALYVYSRPWEVTIDGVKTSGTANVLVGENSSVTVASGTSTISHTSDGSKVFSYSFGQTYNLTLDNGTWMGAYSGSGSGTLPTIARASQPSLVTWPDSTANVGDFGEEFSIHMNRKSDKFTHTVRYTYGDRSGTIATGVTTGTTWTVPLSFMNDIPNAVSASGRIYVDTYNGSTLIGTKYTGFTVTVPASVKPTVTAALEDTTGVDDIYGSPVCGLSKIKVTASATPAYSSPIKSYSITIDGQKYAASTVTTGLLQNEGDSVVKVTATDSRGRMGSWEYTMHVQGYSGPNISRLTVKRCDEDGTDNDQGKYIQVTFSATVDDKGGYNTAAYVLRYKKGSASSWTSKTFTDLVNTYEVTDQTFIFAADESSAYDIELRVSDRHSTATRTTTASTAFSLMDWHPSGTGIRFGGVADEENTFRNDLELHQVGNSYAFQPGAFNGAKGYTVLAAITIKELNVNAPIVFEINRRGVISPMRVYVCFVSSSDTTDPDLDSISYEGSNYGAFLVKEATSTWKLYVDNTSGWSNPCLQRWYTTDNQNARVEVTFPSEQVETLPTPYYRATPAKQRSLLDYLYPVGTIYLSYSHVSPAELFGGTWARIENRFLWATTSGGTIGGTGGEQTHTLTTNEMPKHSHNPMLGSTRLGGNGGTSSGWRMEANATWSQVGTYATTASAGGGAAHNNMPPYIQISAWRRTE